MLIFPIFISYFSYFIRHPEEVCLYALRQHKLTHSITLEAFATTEACEVVFAVVTFGNWVKFANEVVVDLRLHLDVVYFLH